MSSLAVRHRQPELMDNPDLEATLHQQALMGLRRGHWISGTAATLWKPIHRLADQAPESTLRILDVACGGGDVAVALAVRARRFGISIDISGCDISQTAIDRAMRTASAHSVQANFFRADAVSSPLPGGYDIVYSSLFLHHLDDADAVKLLQSMKQAAGRMVLVNDVIRSRLGYVLMWCGLCLLTRSRICHVDGLRSVRAAFTLKEVQEIATRAKLNSAVLTRHWPQRFLLTWSRP